MGDLSPDSSEFFYLDGAATAWTIMGEIGNERKVRCHKGAVENLPGQFATCMRTRILKMVTGPTVHAFRSFLSFCTEPGALSFVMHNM